jgi:hypothetical protein
MARSFLGAPARTSVPSGARTAPAVGERSVRADVEEDVAALPAPGETLLRVIDDLVGADRAEEVHVPRAGHGGDARPERPGDLDGERPHAAARSVDQHPLPGPHARLGAQALQGREPRDGEGRGLLERQAARLRPQAVLGGRHGLGEGPVPRPEDLVAGLEARHVAAGGLDLPGQVGAPDAAPGIPHQRGDEVRQPPHEVPVGGVDRGRADPHEHTVVAGGRLLDLPELENLGRAVSVLDDGLRLEAPPPPRVPAFRDRTALGNTRRRGSSP